MTTQAIEKIAYAAFEHFNRKMKTTYTSDNVKLAFYDNSDADAQYDRFCEQYFPYRLTGNNELWNANASAFTGKDFNGIMIRRDFSGGQSEPLYGRSSRIIAHLVYPQRYTHGRFLR